MDTSTCTRPTATTAGAHSVAADATPSAPPAADLSDDQLEERLCVLAAQLAVMESEFLLLVAELDTRGLWGRAGLRSAAHWLSWRLGLRLGSAREKVRVGHALTGLPSIAAAYGEGRLSYCKVRALTRVATPATEAELLEIGLGTTGAQCETVIRAWRKALTAEMSASSQLRRSFRRRTEADGSVVYTLRVASDDAPVVDAAMDLARRTVLDDDGHPVETPEETALAAEITADPPVMRAEADAFLLLAESFVAANGPTGERGDGIEVVLYAELTDLLPAEPTESEPTEPTEAAAVRSPTGQPLLSSTALRRLCEASVRVFLNDPDGRPLDLGRRRRHASPKQRRALHIRDRGRCRHPGCTQRHRLIPHHVDWWSRGGPTDLDNLILFCPSHHRAVHEVGYTVIALGGGRFRFIAPDGREIVEHPDLAAHAAPMPAARWPAPAPTWGGEHLDLSHLIDGMAANHLNGTGARLPDIPAADLHQTLRDAVGWPVASPDAAPGEAA